MPAAKLCSSGNLNAMKTEEGNDSLDGYMRQAMGKEPLLPFPKTVDSSVQWIQLLHALDQPDLPGWPLLTPVKVQMQKCEKCSREFCSPINYRRHIRVHRRSLIVNKEWHKNRDILAAFWDKLLLEQAREVVSFNDVILKDIPGSSIIKALASSLHRPGAWSWTLPQAYVKAGATLLDIIQDEPSRLPISSQELFSILDDASERTFLCGGTAESVQKYVFYGETAKNSLELKNLVALTSFLFEQLLVKAWIADKDVEALRCQKLLVEEEEAAQKRQALLLERKNRKKLRQKEQKAREQYYGCSRDLNVYVDDVDRPNSAEASPLSSPSDSNSNSQDVPTTLDSVKPLDNESDEDIEVSTERNKQPDSPAVEILTVGANGHHHPPTNRLKSQRGSWYVIQANSNFQTPKLEPTRKLPPPKDRSLHNGNKVWTKKLKSKNNSMDNPRPPSSQEVTSHKIEQNNDEVIIGSIPVTLKSYTGQQQGSRQNEIQDTSITEPKKKNASEKPGKSASLQPTNRVVPKHWRPVSRGETKNCPAVDRRNQDPNNGAVLGVAHDSTPSDNDGRQDGKQFRVISYNNSLSGAFPFSSEAAKEFLARRWKEAISGDHVKLVLSSEPLRSNAPSHGDNQYGRSIQVHATRKPEKSLKFKYIPKQKAAA